jgi:type VI secretion system secreted protein Hcp
MPGASSGASTGKVYEINLDLGSIQGESTSSTHPNTIEIDSFSFVMTNTPVRTGSGPQKGGKVSISEVELTKAVDKATSQLCAAVSFGQLFKTATLTWSKSTGGKKPEDYMTITLTNALVTSVHLTSPGSRGIGVESVSLSFDSIAITYMVQGKDGLLTRTGAWSYSLAAGA